jgi:hypothetical protein
MARPEAEPDHLESALAAESPRVRCGGCEVEMRHFRYAKVREQRVVLEHHPELAPIRRHGAMSAPPIRISPLSGVVNPPMQRSVAFAAPGGPRSEELTFTRKRDPVDDVGAVSLGQLRFR